MQQTYMCLSISKNKDHYLGFMWLIMDKYCLKAVTYYVIVVDWPRDFINVEFII